MCIRATGVIYKSLVSFQKGEMSRMVRLVEFNEVLFALAWRLASPLSRQQPQSTYSLQPTPPGICTLDESGAREDDV